MTDKRRFLFLLSSARADGNAEILARRAAAQLPKHNDQRWLALRKLALPAFVDTRHQADDGTYAMPTGDALHLLQETLSATDIVFVAPLYWYSLPAPAKLYLDHWSGWMRLSDVDFQARMRGKRLWVITIISDPDRSTAEPLLGGLRLTASYMNMAWAGAVVGYGNRAGDVLNDDEAVATAENLFAAG